MSEDTAFGIVLTFVLIVAGVAIADLLYQWGVMPW
jgi:hypothetical protein